MSTEPVYFDKWSIAEIIKHQKHCDTHNYTYILVVDYLHVLKTEHNLVTRFF